MKRPGGLAIAPPAPTGAQSENVVPSMLERVSNAMPVPEPACVSAPQTVRVSPASNTRDSNVPALVYGPSASQSSVMADPSGVRSLATSFMSSGIARTCKTVQVPSTVYVTPVSVQAIR